ncbi:unnamed protein product [Protopolystoma xenopodis]|uniref:Uncharacterized protein n=1 Tax=Protopolystoma xenopodis TaxID=117903 RepID=A0A448WFC7_9PLAT|nr:unnamed protein product [Protopolystoma xenopodis]
MLSTSTASERWSLLEADTSAELSSLAALSGTIRPNNVAILVQTNEDDTSSPAAANVVSLSRLLDVDVGVCLELTDRRQKSGPLACATPISLTSVTPNLSAVLAPEARVASLQRRASWQNGRLMRWRMAEMSDDSSLPTWSWQLGRRATGLLSHDCPAWTGQPGSATSLVYWRWQRDLYQLSLNDRIRLADEASEASEASETSEMFEAVADREWRKRLRSVPTLFLNSAGCQGDDS